MILSVWPREQVAHSFAHAQGISAPPLMLWAIMDHVAPLAKGLEVPRRVVGRIVVEMRGRQHDTGAADGEAIPHDQAGQGPPAPVDPPAARLVPPSSVAEVLNVLAVRPVALLASAAGPLEPDHL